MGLLINKELTTNAGVDIPVGAYVNISEYYVSKASGVQIAVNVYKDKIARTEGKRTLDVDFITTPYSLDLTAAELALDNMYAVIYGRLKEELNLHFGEEVVVDEI